MLKSVSNQLPLQSSTAGIGSTQNIDALPSDLEKVVGKVYLKVIEIISRIKAFFSVVFYTKNGFNSFTKKVNDRFNEISNEKKISLYQKYKKSAENCKNDRVKVGFKTFSDNQKESLKKSNKNLDEYKEYEIKFTAEEINKIKSFLKQKYQQSLKEAQSNILFIDINQFLSMKNIPDEIKNLLDEKLNQIPEYKILKKNLEDKKQNIRYNNLKKAAIITSIFAAFIAISLASYNYIKVPASIVPVSIPEPSSCFNFSLFDMQVLRNISTSIVPVSIPELPNYSNFLSLFNIQILGRTSTMDVKNLPLKIAKFLIQRPFEAAVNSQFLIKT